MHHPQTFKQKVIVAYFYTLSCEIIKIQTFLSIDFDKAIWSGILVSINEYLIKLRYIILWYKYIMTTFSICISGILLRLLSTALL